MFWDFGGVLGCFGVWGFWGVWGFVGVWGFGGFGVFCGFGFLGVFIIIIIIIKERFNVAFSK